MATIASLAIKVQANINDLTRDMDVASKSVSEMAMRVRESRGSLADLEDMSKALTSSSNLLSKAQYELHDALISSTEYEGIQRRVEGLTDAVKNSAQATAEGIAKAAPSLENFRKACGQFTELQKLAETMRQTTGDSTAMAETLKTAETNLRELAVSMGQAKAQQMAFSAALIITNMPLKLLWDVLSEISSEMMRWLRNFNDYFNGIPGIAAKITIVIVGILALIGYCASGTLAWSGVTAYLMALWKSNVIVVGLSTVISGLWAGVTATSTWLAAQLGLNVAWTYFLAATGIGLILVAVAGIVAGITALVSWLYSGSKATDEMTNRIKAMETSTAAFQAIMGEFVDKYKELNNAAKQYHDANQTGAQKYLAELQKIDEVMNRKSVEEQIKADYVAKLDELMSAVDKTSDAKELESLQKQIDDIGKEIMAFDKERKNSPVMDSADAAAAKDAALQQYRESLGIVKTDAELLAEQTRKLSEGLSVGAITQSEFNSLMQAAKEKYDPAVKAEIESMKLLEEEYKKELTAAEELAKMESDARKQLADKFRSMQPKTPTKEFDDLSAQLNSIRQLLSPAEFAGAKQKLLDDMASGLGIAEFVNPKQSETMQSMQAKVLEYYNKLDALGRATFDLTAAQQRVKESFEKQSGFYSDYQKMMEDMKSPADKLSEYVDKLMADANTFGWDENAVQALIEKKTKELENADTKQTEQLVSDNKAFVYGTMEYFKFQNQSSNPQLAESKKQTVKLENINKTMKDNNEKLDNFKGVEFITV